jgi:hypothetical protein
MAHTMTLRNGKSYQPLEHTPKRRRKPDTPSEIATAVQAYNHNATSNFLRLPAELHDMIYAYVWANESAFIFRQHRIFILVSPAHAMDVLPHRYGMPRWMLSSGAMLYASLAALHRQLTFWPIPEARLRTRMGATVFARAPSPNPLLFSPYVRNVALRAAHYVVAAGRPALHWRVQPEERWFEKYLRAVGAREVRLVLEMKMTMQDDAPHETGFEEVRFFAGSCRRLTLRLDCTAWWRVRETVSGAWERCQEVASGAGQWCVREILGTERKVEEEMSMVGNAMIVFECKRLF